MKLCIKKLNYLKEMKITNTALLVIALCEGILVTLMAYPGFMYAVDSYERWDMAYSLAVNGPNFSSWTNWFSIIPQLIMAFCYKITGNYAMYTFLQETLFLFTSFCVVNMLLKSWRSIFILLIALYPVIWVRGVQMETASGAIIGLNLFLIILLKQKSDSDKRVFEVIRDLIGLIVAGLLVFGYRQNALTIFPVLIAIICYKNRDKLQKTLKCIAAVMSVILVIGIPTILGIPDIFDVSGIGVLWDTVTAIEVLKNEEKRDDYDKYIEELSWLASKSEWDKAVAYNSHQNIYGFNEGIPAALGASKENASHLKKMYLKMCVEIPETVLRAKIEIAKHTLGISEPLSYKDIKYNDLGKMEMYGMRDTVNRKWVMNKYYNVSSKNPFLMRPWLNFLFTGVIVVVTFFLLNSWKDAFWIFLLAVFYYGAFFINTQSCEVRYFFPAYYLLLICKIKLIDEWLDYNANRKRRGKSCTIVK